MPSTPTPPRARTATGGVALSLTGLLALVSTSGLQAQDPVTYFYGGEVIPAAAPYAAWFTTVGPGHPTGSYFGGTTWSANGTFLTMTTQHPGDYAGATSQGIWFGRTDGYGDPSNFSLAPAALGNNVTARLALAPNSSEWSLYWFDANGYEAAIYLVSNGFTYYTAAGGTFVPVADMNAFHDFGTHLHNGVVSYSIDGVSLAGGPAIATGFPNFLLLGDGSATDVSGYGSLLVDSLSITVNAGAPIPEPSSFGLALAGATLCGSIARRRRNASVAVAEG